MSRRLEAVVIAATLSVAGMASGATWTRGDLPFEPVYEVAAHPTLPGIAFAATASGAYRTTDAGLHWQRVTDLHLGSFSFNPFRDVEVCATSPYCSVDVGLTWIPTSGFGLSFFDRSVPDRMYALPSFGSDWIFVSNDHGKTWKLHGHTDGQPYIHAQGASDLGSTLFETIWPHGGLSNYLRPLYRSSDGGDTWVAIPIDGVTYPWEPVGPPNQWIVATDRSRRSMVYFACCGMFRASSDEGTTWEVRGQMQLTTYSLAADPANSAIVYVGGGSGSVMQSLDGGWSWHRIDGDQIYEAPISNDIPDPNRINRISIGADGTVYAATANAVFAMRIVARRHAAGRR